MVSIAGNLDESFRNDELMFVCFRLRHGHPANVRSAGSIGFGGSVRLHGVQLQKGLHVLLSRRSVQWCYEFKDIFAHCNDIFSTAWDTLNTD